MDLEVEVGAMVVEDSKNATRKKGRCNSYL